MVGINMVGVNLPGHFMIRPADVPECEILVDCFHDGDVLFVEDAEKCSPNCIDYGKANESPSIDLFWKITT